MFLIYLFLLFFAFFIRFFRIQELFSVSGAEEQQMYFVKDLLINHHLSLVGMPVARSDFYLGPIFTWISAIPYYFSNFDPIGGAWAITILGAVTTVVLAWGLIEISKSRLAGILAGFLYAVNPLINAYDKRFWWNASFIPLLTIIWLVALIKVQKDSRWLIVLAFVFGLAFHIHYSLFFLLPVTIWRLVRLRPSLKILSVSLILFAICFFPVVLGAWTYNLNFHETNMSLGENGNSILDKSKIFFQMINRLFWVGWNQDINIELYRVLGVAKTLTLAPYGVILLIAFFMVWISKVYKDITLIIFMVFVSFLLATLFAPFSFKEHYFSALFPLAMIVLSLWFDSMIKSRNMQKTILSITVFGLILVIWTLQTLSWQNHLGLENKKKALLFARTFIGNQPYNLRTFGMYFNGEGYRFIAQSMGFSPNFKFVTPQLQRVLPDNSLPKTPVKNPASAIIIYDTRDILQDQIKAEARDYQLRFGEIVVNGKIGDINVTILKKSN